MGRGYAIDLVGCRQKLLSLRGRGRKFTGNKVETLILRALPVRKFYGRHVILVVVPGNRFDAQVTRKITSYF